MSDALVLSPEESAELRKDTTIVVAYDRAPLVKDETAWKQALADWAEFGCETLEDEDAWSEALGEAQAVFKKIEEVRVEQTGPLDKELKNTNKEFREYQAPLVAFKTMATKVLSAARARRDEAEKAAKLLVAQAADTGDEDATFAALAAVPDKAKVGGTRTVYRWEFEVVEEAIVPAWAKTFDVKKATAHAEANRLKGAGPRIPGVAARYVPVVSTNGRNTK